jgi:putative ABC transport system permease protein
MLTIIVLTISITTIASVFYVTQSIKSGLLNHSYETYGDYQVVLLEQERSEKNKLKEKHQDAQIGEAGLVGTISEEGLTLTVGWMDKSAFNIGRVKVKEGNKPKQNGEVAVEDSYLKTIAPNWAIGETRNFLFKGEEVTYKLVGIIDDYSSERSMPLDVEKGINDFPNIMISEKEGEKYNDSTTLNLLIKVEENIRNAEAESFQLLDEYGYNGYFNENLYYVGLIDYQTINKLTWLFLLFVVVVSGLTIAQLFNYFYSDHMKKIAMMRAVGAHLKHIYLLSFYQVTVLYLVSFFIAIPLIFLLSVAIMHTTFIETSFLFNLQMSDFIFLLIIVIGYFLLSLFLSLIPVIRNKQRAILEMLKGRNERSVETVEIRHFFLIEQLWRQLVAQWKKNVLPILCISSSIFLFFFALFLAKETEGIVENDNYYYLSSQHGYTYQDVGGMTLLPESININLEKVKQLSEHKGVDFIDKSPFTVDIFPLLTREQLSSSIIRWHNEFKEEDGDRNERDRTLENLINGLTPIPNVTILTVNEEELKEITDYFFQSSVDYDAFNDERKGLLFLPGDFLEEEVSVWINDTLLLGRVIENEHGKIELNKWNYTIEHVHHGEFTYPVREGILQERAGITLVVGERDAYLSDLFNGYYELSVYPKENIDLTLQEEIDSLTRELVVSIPGSLYQPIKEWILEESKLPNFLKVLSMLLFIVSIIFSFISIAVTMYGRFMTKKHEWGVFRALGMTKRMMTTCLASELAVYLMISTTLSILPCVLVILFVNHIHSTAQYMSYLFFSILFVVLILIVGSFSLLKLIINKPISALLRIEE